jgi:putative endonuclease
MEGQDLKKQSATKRTAMTIKRWRRALASSRQRRSTRKQRAEAFGRRAERIAGWYLRLKGYHILHQRYRTPAGEIDIIARRGKALAFIEVKARLEGRGFVDAVSDKQKKRIEKAAVFYISRLRKHMAGIIRFDILWVRPWRWPEHVTNAWYREGHCTV